MSHPLAFNSKYHVERPFDTLHIDDNDILSTILSRYVCAKCNKSRKFFCYTCYRMHPDLAGAIPRVKLPLKIDIIKHAREIDGKSTAAHAAILAPDDVTVYTFPNIPTYENEQAVLIFPSSCSLSIPDLFSSTEQSYSEMITKWRQLRMSRLLRSGTMKTRLENIEDDGGVVSHCFPGAFPVTKAVFIDSTWNQSKGIYKDERISRLPCVFLEHRISQFWRHQKGSPRWYLATIEAIHQFLVEMHINAHGLSPAYKGFTSCLSDASVSKYSAYIIDDPKAYSGDYDNLLYFFEYMYKLIHTYYSHEELFAYTRRMQ